MPRRLLPPPLPFQTLTPRRAAHAYFQLDDADYAIAIDADAVMLMPRCHLIAFALPPLILPPLPFSLFTAITPSR